MRVLTTGNRTVSATSSGQVNDNHFYITLTNRYAPDFDKRLCPFRLLVQFAETIYFTRFQSCHQTVVYIFLAPVIKTSHRKSPKMSLTITVTVTIYIINNIYDQSIFTFLKKSVTFMKIRLTLAVGLLR